LNVSSARRRSTTSDQGTIKRRQMILGETQLQVDFASWCEISVASCFPHTLYLMCSAVVRR
jgi:hypothetical protein